MVIGSKLENINNEDKEINLKMAMYYYECPTWWGWIHSKGIRNITISNQKKTF